MIEHLSYGLQLLPYALITLSIIKNIICEIRWHQLGVGWSHGIDEIHRLLFCYLSPCSERELNQDTR